LLRKPDITSHIAAGALLGGGVVAAWAYLPKFARAPTGAIRADRRDPAWVRWMAYATVARRAIPIMPPLHGSIALDIEWTACGFDAGFVFRAASGDAGVRADVQRDHAAVIHAVATSYRDRSHFDGQDVLESGFAGPGRVQSAGSTARWKSCRAATA